MSGLWEAVGFGVVLGFSLAAPPGPMNAWIASIATRSYRAGVVTGLGAMTADALLGAAVYLLDRVVDLGSVVRFVYLLGAVVMGFLGARLVRTAPSVPEEPAAPRTFARALGVGLSNPFQLLWWLTAGVAFAYLGGAPLLVGLFSAIVVWVLTFPWVVRAGARRDPRVASLVRYASALILIAFAAYFAALFVLA